MTSEEIKSLFPIKGNVTQEILDSAQIYNVQQCIGAKTLRAALNIPDLEVDWGSFSGTVWSGIEYIKISTKEELSMMTIKEPTTVTFVIIDKNKVYG